MAEETNSPIPFKRLEQIATDVCKSALAGVEYYEHPKTASWNEDIIQKMLKAVMAESNPEGAASPAYKFAINSTIVQHVVPTAHMNKAAGATVTEGKESHASSGKKRQAGRRGMHSATGGYWNEKTDGMWSYKFDGEDLGLDVVIMLIWIGV